MVDIPFFDFAAPLVILTPQANHCGTIKRDTCRLRPLEAGGESCMAGVERLY